MAITVIENGKVVYGDPQELRSVQLAEMRAELERIEADIERLMASLQAAQALVAGMQEQLREPQAGQGRRARG